LLTRKFQTAHLLIFDLNFEMFDFSNAYSPTQYLLDQDFVADVAHHNKLTAR